MRGVRHGEQYKGQLGGGGHASWGAMQTKTTALRNEYYFGEDKQTDIMCIFGAKQELEQGSPNRWAAQKAQILLSPPPIPIMFYV